MVTSFSFVIFVSVLDRFAMRTWKVVPGSVFKIRRAVKKCRFRIVLLARVDCHELWEWAVDH